MSLALKRRIPFLYNFLKKYEKYIPASTELWDKKKYILNLQIISMLNYWKHYPRLKKEAELVYSLYEGGDFIDVGAHHGVYSFLLAPKANIDDTFVQCEPDPNAKKNLLGNLKVFKKLFSHIKLEFVFDPVSNSDSVTKHPTDYGHPVYFSKTKNNASEKSIDSVQIDELVEKLGLNPKFIKIDVEGAEYEVLQGAVNTLKNYKALIMLEKHPTLIPKNITFDTIDNLLNKAGYEKERLVFEDDIAITEVWKNYN
jgi:FkbM family methyltransferase|tara:strand:+ start:635 stop:1399 length:765 start_codon:yes stop_codon:yes gene_type:complete